MRFTILFLLVASFPTFAAERSSVDYIRDVRPILANSCYACHGPDDKARKAKLRLDVREEAIKKAIVPGKASESPLLKRAISTDADEVMPPAHAKKPSITPDKADILKRWIDDGAKFDEHWAYAKPQKPAVPEVKNKAWVRNPIDAFIAQGHERNGFTAAGEADRVTLIRRLSFDLLGLPPSPADVDAFVNDASPQAYEKMVNRFLASKHFGERMALMWLDAVRYADTAGYHSDNHRDVWLFRNYVIDSFNNNKPFDHFTLDQLAGDLTASPSNEQRIASGYNKMLMTTEEGGAQAKEYTAKYAADRVRNASNAWLGSTMGCCECHNHKYDPFTQKDFYRFAAFFADVQEVPVGRQPQTPIMSADQAAELKKLEDEVTAKKNAITSVKIIDAGRESWETTAKKNSKGLPKPVIDALNIESDKRTDAQKKTLAQHYRENVAPETETLRKELAAATAKRDGYKNSIPTTLVAMTGAPRMVRILPRGNWLDDSGEAVKPDVPEFLGAIGKTDRATRMDLAKWVISPENPLTARVFVNRLWKIAFGQGLVRNLDDFGTQGTPPTHPELLDWLATEFVASKWDVKAMLKLMVTSNTYRQSSVAPKALREKDPSNIWLARQNRFRIDAEFVRDNALAVSGLFNPTIGGPSVKPYQPPGFWAMLNFPQRDWAADKNENQYRRGMYTYWCRSFPHPSLTAFDAPSREECTNERPRSSTPLQALVLLNDPTYVEASRVFATSILKEKSTADRLNAAYRQALSRNAKPEEIKVLESLLAKHLAEFKKDPEAAKKLLSVGIAPMPKDVDVAELAAWTSVCRAIMNLHEAVTRN